MKRKVSGKKNAFTIAELVIVMIILGIFSMGVYAFFANSVRLQAKQGNEYRFQADMRDSMLTIETKVKKSKSIFAIPQNEFLAPDGKPFDRLWTYIGVVQSGPNAGHVCMFECENPNDSAPPVWKETVLTSGTDDIEYKLSFKKSGESGISQKKLDYSLTGKASYGIERTLSSTTEVLTAAAVVDRGSDANPSTVIAIRNGKVKPARTPSLTFIVDVSGSMNNSFGSVNRMEGARRAFRQMVDALYAEGFPVDICIVDFGSFADTVPFAGKDKWHYGNILSDYEEVHQIINKLNPHRPVPGRIASTNIGDGLRIGSESIKKNMALNPGEEKSRFMVLLTDGLPTTATSELVKKGGPPPSDYDYSFYDRYDRKTFYYKYYTGYDQVAGTALKCPDGYNFSPVYLKYATMMGEKYRPGNPNATPPISPGAEPIQGLKSYVISVGDFSATQDNVFKQINASMGNGNNKYYNARQESDPKEAIGYITADFLTDAWTYAGPRVTP